MANAITDSMLAGEWKDEAVISFMNNGGIRSELPAGDITGINWFKSYFCSLFLFFIFIIPRRTNRIIYINYHLPYEIFLNKLWNYHSPNMKLSPVP